jgi:hypothetical protein
MEKSKKKKKKMVGGEKNYIDVILVGGLGREREISSRFQD